MAIEVQRAPVGYVYYCGDEDPQDLEAYPVRGNCMAPKILDADRVIVNKSLIPHDGDIVTVRADRFALVATYRVDENGKPHLVNGEGARDIPTGASLSVVVAVNRKV